MSEYQLPDGWEWKRLGNVCKTTSGGTPSRNRPDYYNGDIPWIKSGELTDGLVSDYGESITQKAIEKSSAKLLPKGTLLMAMYGATVGKLGILDISAATNQAVCAIFPSPQVHQKFLFWYLYIKREDLIKLSFGGAQPNISQTIIKDIEIPLPPLDEQKRIAAIIDEQMQDVETARQAILAELEAAEALSAAYLREVFESDEAQAWEMVKFGQKIATLQRGYDLPKRLRVSGNYPLISSSGEIDSHNEYKVRSPGVVTGRSGSVGKIHYVEEDFWPLNTTLYVKDFKGNYPRYIYYFLHVIDLESFASGATVPTLDRKNVHRASFHLPSYDKQIEIANYLDVKIGSLQELLDIIQGRLLDIEAMPAAILRRAFSGGY